MSKKVEFRKSRKETVTFRPDNQKRYSVPNKTEGEKVKTKRRNLETLNCSQ